MQQYQCIKQPKGFDDINFERRFFTYVSSHNQYAEGFPLPYAYYLELYCEDLDYYISIEAKEFLECFVKYPYETNMKYVEIKEPQGETKEMNKVQRHKELCEGLNETYKEKNKNYGDSFGISVKKYGYISALTRMSDKWNRLEQLILNRSNGTKDESLTDTLIDLANYCLMTVMELEEEKAKHDSMWKEVDNAKVTIGTPEDLEKMFKESTALKSN